MMGMREMTQRSRSSSRLLPWICLFRPIQARLYNSRSVYAHPAITDQTAESPEAVGRYLVSHGILTSGADDDERLKKNVRGG
jgi:hypothetical protein